MSVVCEQIGKDGSVTLYPHGVEGHGVVLNAQQQNPGPMATRQRADAALSPVRPPSTDGIFPLLPRRPHYRA